MLPVREPVLMEDHHLVVDVRRRVWLVCVHAHMRTIDCEREVRDGGDPRDLVGEEVERVEDVANHFSEGPREDHACVERVRVGLLRACKSCYAVYEKRIRVC